MPEILKKYFTDLRLLRMIDTSDDAGAHYWHEKVEMIDAYMQGEGYRYLTDLLALSVLAGSIDIDPSIKKGDGQNV